MSRSFAGLVADRADSDSGLGAGVLVVVDPNEAVRCRVRSGRLIGRSFARCRQATRSRNWTFRPGWSIRWPRCRFRRRS